MQTVHSIVIVFLDEIDAAMGRRSNEKTSEETRTLQNTFYAHSGTETNSVLIIGATNTPELLDKAFLSRMDEKIGFSLPDFDTRINLINQYWNQYVKGIDYDGNWLQTIGHIAENTEGFSGRELSQLVRSYGAAAYTNNNTLTFALIKQVTEDRVKQHQKFNKEV